jgi:hypothetical protein
MNTSNTIPERISDTTSISIETTNAPDRPLSDLPECPPRIYNENNQERTLMAKAIYP